MTSMPLIHIELRKASTHDSYNSTQSYKSQTTQSTFEKSQLRRTWSSRIIPKRVLKTNDVEWLAVLEVS
jgi:hypothetical protein